MGGGGRKIDVSNESHFSTSGGKRRDKKRMKQKLKFLEQ
jgi:hypothetical protein